MNTGKISALREVLIRLESTETALDEAVKIAYRADYSDFAKDIKQRALAVEHIRCRVARRLFELEQTEVEFGLSKK